MLSLIISLITAAVAVVLLLNRCVCRDKGSGSLAQAGNGEEEKSQIQGPDPSHRAKGGRQSRQNARQDHVLQNKSALYKELYFKLQNLEEHPEVLPKARQTLVSLLSEGLEIERRRPSQRSILEIDVYDPKTLKTFLTAEQDEVTAAWQQYVEGRANGKPRDLFNDRPSAAEWLKQHAPTKYVDGAWLGHIHVITTAYFLYDVTKDAWQVLSEEFGDGDLNKNHVFLYRRLLDEVGVSLPASYDSDFVHPRHGIKNTSTWKAGTAQLLISLFPHDFLPEILGFNMHFELLTLETLKAAKELPEVGISGYYFTLHVSIDNADSGHTAMAFNIVARYLEVLGRVDSASLPQMWKRIQAGYILSKTVGDSSPLSEHEQRVVRMLRTKADASHQLHCSSRVKIGQLTLAQWLSPDTWTGTEDCKQGFLQALANAKPWVVRGNSSRSLLMRELSWGGKMFGAFTHSEFEELQEWINGLDSADIESDRGAWPAQKQSRSDRIDNARLNTHHDVALHHPVFQSDPPPLNLNVTVTASCLTDLQRGPMDISNASVDAIIPLWLAHPCILQNMVNVPYRTSAVLVSHVLRVLRAESGFLEEGPSVAGTDEQFRSRTNSGLVKLGLEMIQRLDRTAPTNLHDVLKESAEKSPLAVDFARRLLNWAMRPVRGGARPIGLALAFVDFEEAVLCSDFLLSAQGQQTLRQIIKRKRAALNDYLDLLKGGDRTLHECRQWYVAGRLEINSCLEQKEV